MHDALIWIARAIAPAHDHWRGSIGRRRTLSGKTAVLEEQVQRLRAQNERLRARWLRVPANRRIAGKLARMGVKASRSSVQRILRRPRAPEPDDRVLPRTVSGLRAKRPNHIWLIDFTRLGGVVKPVFVGAVIDA
jgi:hypothetical protein